MNTQHIDTAELERMLEECKSLTSQGKPADYIPALAQVDPDQLGACMVTKYGSVVTAGDADVKFSIQSIVKVMIFTRCLLDNDTEKVLEKVSVEPTSDGFNSIKELEMKNNNKPLNPMINAGAIVCMSLVKGKSNRTKRERVLQLIRKLANNPEIDSDDEIYQSEKKTGSRNRALTYYMQSTGIIDQDQDVEKLLNAYFYACSINVTCQDIARIALVYAMDGVDPSTGEQIIPKDIARIVKATVVMCGMYNESGMVASTVGLPTKSGVGGGLLSIIPGEMGIGIYGPALNPQGSSIAGLRLLQNISKRLDASVF